MEGKNKINVYKCPKGHETVTVNRDEGVTSFMLRCRQKDDDGKHNCTEFAKSQMYMVDQNLKPEFEWFKPDSLKGYNENMKEHFRNGGLEIRKIKS